MEELYQLTNSQRRCLAIDEIYTGSSVNTVGGVFHYKGPVDINRLCQAAGAALGQFDALRTVFVWRNEQVYQHFNGEADERCEHMDFRHQHQQHLEQATQAYHDWVGERFKQPLKPQAGELFELCTFTVSDSHSGYLIKLHHSIGDGWSIALLSAFIKHVYEGGQVSNDDECHSFKTIVEHESSYLSSNRYHKDQQFWHQYLADNAASLPSIPSTDALSGERLTYQMQPEELAAVKRLCQNYGCSINTFFIGLYVVYQSNISGVAQGSVGLPVMQRKSRQQRQVFGMSTGHIPFLYQLDKNESPAQLFGRFSRQLKQCYKHGQYPFNELLAHLSKTREQYGPLYDVSINYYNFDHASQVAGLAQLVEEFYVGEQSYGLQIAVKEESSAVKLMFDYQHEKYSKVRIAALCQGLRQLIQQLDKTLGSESDGTIAALSVISPAQLEQRQQLMNGPVVSSVDQAVNQQTILSLFDCCVERFGQSTALMSEGVAVSYAQLAKQSKLFAAGLQQQGLKQGDMIGIMADHGVDTVVALWGVLRLGAAFVPLNRHFPRQRLLHMCHSAQIKMLLHDSIGKATATTLGLATVSVSQLLVSQLPVLPIVPVSQLAYLLYTSGSTGKPKGVRVSHESLFNYINWAGQQYFCPQDRVALYSPLNFDLTITSLFAPLVIGATIVLYPEQDTESLFTRMINNDQISAIKLTPSHLSILKAVTTHAGSLQTLIVGGEDFKTSLAQDIQAQFPKASIYNEYGPTEATVGCMCYKYSGQLDSLSVPLGQPIINTEICLLSPWGTVVPDGEVGELTIFGRSVASGYAGQEASRGGFCASEQSIWPRGYRTGDFAWVIDGQIYYKGRGDRQIKLHGYRIELNDIEAAILSFSGVSSATVTVLVDQQGHEQGKVSNLVAGITPAIIDIDSLRVHLGNILPHYMIPNMMVAIDNIPLTANGKTDTSEMLNSLNDNQQHSETTLQVQTDIVDIICKILNCSNIDLQQNLFSLGMDSIKSVQIASLIRRLGYEVSATDILDAANIEQLCGRFRQTRLSVAQDVEALEPLKTPVQQWFFGQQFAKPDLYAQVAVLKLASRQSIKTLGWGLTQLMQVHRNLTLAVGEPDNRLYFSAPEQDFEPDYIDCQYVDQLPAVIWQTVGKIKLANHRPIQAASIDCDNDQYLVLAVHHLCIDVYSWFTLLNDLDGLLGANKQAVVGNHKTCNFSRWSHYIARKSFTLPPESIAYWQQVTACQSASFSADFSAGSSVNSADLGVSRISQNLNHTLTSQLAKAGKQWFAVDLETLFLVALSAALEGFSSGSACRIDIERFGRDSWPNQPDISDTVGWFTNIHPIILPTKSQGFDQTLIELKASLACVPDKGASYGLAAYLSGQIEPVPSSVRFNFIGDAMQFGFEHFALNAQLSDLYASADNAPQCAVDLCIRNTGSAMNVAFQFDHAQISEDEAKQLMCLFIDKVTALNVHLQQHKQRVLSPADFDSVELSVNEIEDLFI